MILQVHSQEVVEVEQNFACFADVEILTDHVTDLSSLQESMVLLCLWLFRGDSPLEVCSQSLLEITRNFQVTHLEVWNHSSQYQIGRLKFVHTRWRNCFHGCTPQLLLENWNWSKLNCLKFIFQNTNVVKFRKCLNSFNKFLRADKTERKSPVAGNPCVFVLLSRLFCAASSRAEKTDISPALIDPFCPPCTGFPLTAAEETPNTDEQPARATGKCLTVEICFQRCVRQPIE